MSDQQSYGARESGAATVRQTGMVARLRRAIPASVVCVGLLGAFPVAAQAPLEVKVAEGPVSGVATGDLQSWLGIPYAAAPVGPLRWRPPQPATAWTVTRKANTVASNCAQNADLGAFARAGGSEDCLYLNVYRSAQAAGSEQKLPVFAYEFGDRTAPSYVGPTTFPLLAAHTFELAYIFPGFRGGADVTVRLNPLQERLSDQMVDWFARSGTLSAQGGWPRFEGANGSVMRLKLPTAEPEPGNRFAEAHHCAFWDKAGTY